MMSIERSAVQRKSNRLCWIQNALTSIAFALVALCLSGYIVASGGNPNLSGLSPFAAFGAFLSSLILWPKDFGDRVRLLTGSIRGILIGLFANPIMVSMVLLSTVLFDDSWERGLSLENPGEMLWGAVAFVLWGTFCALIGVGWLTALLGGVTGFMIAAIIGITENYLARKAGKRNPQPAMPLDEHNHPDNLARIKLEHSKRRLLGAIVSLVVISVFTVPATYILSKKHRAEIQQQEVIIEKPSEPWEAEE